MRSTLETDVPPNFITRKDMTPRLVRPVSTGSRHYGRAGPASSAVARTLSHKVPGPQQPKRARRAVLAFAGRGEARWGMQQGKNASSPTPVAHTLDAAEIARFARHAEEWWDEQGKFRPLHQIAP